MAVEEGAAVVSPLWCAQCENAPAIFECFEEELLYCAPCSASLHSKRARLHHCVKPFRTCDECERAVARVKCARCAGKEGGPLVFCASCSALLHSKKARYHHPVEALDRVEAGKDEVSVPLFCEEGEALNAKEGASLRDKQGAVSTTSSEKGFSCAEKPITQELHETKEKRASTAIAEQAEKVAHTTPSCPTPTYPNYSSAPFSWHPFTGNLQPMSTNCPLDGPWGNPGHIQNVPFSCHPHLRPNPSGFMPELHQFFPVYYPHLGLFPPASTYHGNSERAQPCASLFKVDSAVFKSGDKADTEKLGHQQPQSMPEALHGSCSKKRLSPDATATSPTLTIGTLQSELTSQPLPKRMHNIVSTEVQRSDLVKDSVENKHGIAPVEGCVENEHAEGGNELSPNILESGDLSKRTPIIGSLCNIIEVPYEANHAIRNAIGEENNSDHVEREQNCTKISQGEGVLEKEPTSSSFGKALPNVGSCSKSSNQVLSEVSLGECHRSKPFSELVSATGVSRNVFGKVSASNFPCGQAPSVLAAGVSAGNVHLAELQSASASASASEKLPNVQLDGACVEKVSIDDAHAKDPPPEMLLPKEELVEYYEQACEGSPEMCLRERNSCRFLGKTSPKVSIVNEDTRNLSARKLKAEDEEKKLSKDTSEESYSEGDTSADDKTFKTKNYLRRSVTIEAVVMYSDDYDAPSSITGTIVQSLEHGLLSGSDADARRAVKDAQRHLTKYNLKQAQNIISHAVSMLWRCKCTFVIKTNKMHPIRLPRFFPFVWVLACMRLLSTEVWSRWL